MKEKIIRILLAAAVLIAVMAACSKKEEDPLRDTPDPGILRPEGDEEFLNTILITVSEPFTEEELASLLDRYGLTLVYDFGHAGIYAFRCEGAQDYEALRKVMDEMAKEPKILTVEQDRKVTLTDPVQDRPFPGKAGIPRPGIGPGFNRRYKG